MRIDKRLNLIVPIYSDDGKTVIAQVYSTPLSVDVVKRHSIILAQVYAQIVARGLLLVGGAKVALQLLENIATAEGTWNDIPGKPGSGVASSLVEEMRRLTNVAAKQQDGNWNQVPLEVAARQGVISAMDVWEVENAIVFFTVVYAMLPTEQRAELTETALNVSGAQTSSLSSTEFMASLKTSTSTDNTGERSLAPASVEPGPANAIVDGKPASVPR